MQIPKGTVPLGIFLYKTLFVSRLFPFSLFFYQFQFQTVLFYGMILLFKKGFLQSAFGMFFIFCRVEQIVV